MGKDRTSANEFFVVGVGASAGGVEALSSLVSHIPGDTGMAFVVVLHLAPDKPSILPEILARAGHMEVVAAEEGARLEPNRVYVIRPGDSLTVRDGALHRTARAEPPGRHLPVDILFRSLAEDQGDRAIGVVLTGGDRDGVDGLAAIRSTGGITLAQDPGDATHPQMPQHSIDAGVVDKVLAIEEIGGELVIISRRSGMDGAAQTLWEDERASEAFGEILKIVEQVVGVDFQGYKQGTLARRIAKRMLLHRMEDPGEYLDYLQENEEEVRELYENLLIMVTEFFRESETFEILKSDILPNILQRKPENRPVRIWVVGCSTGEEAYSLAIAILEYFRKNPRPPVQIFATDVNARDIEQARSGVYSERIREEVCAQKLRRYFDEVPGGYQVKKIVREMCIFAPHDVTKDPPFTKVDLVSCRNVLIYFGKPLQDRLMSIFHYALDASGFLVLGRSESVSQRQDLFEAVDRKNNIYSRLPARSQLPVDLAHPLLPGRLESGIRGAEQNMRVRTDSLDIKREVDDLVASRYAPPAVVVDTDYRIIQFRGDTGRYLRNPPGEASFDVVSMAREGLSEPIRVALESADRRQGPVIHRGAEVKPDGSWMQVDLEVLPLRAGASQGEPIDYFIVSFHEDAQDDARRAPVEAEESSGGKEVDEAEVLRRELSSTRHHLQSVIRDREKANDELLAAYEEIQSSNEELQSINEELETAKEELQRINEELTTVNEELRKRNEELTEAYDDLTNLLSGTSIPVIMVGDDLRIRRFTPGIEQVANIMSSDVGRPITDIRLKVSAPDLVEHVHRAINHAASVDREVRHEEGCWYSLRVRPYRRADARIEGAVLTFVDIEEIKRNVELAEEAAFSEARSAINGVVSTASESAEVIELAMAEAGAAIDADSAFYAAREEDGEWVIELSHQITRKVIGRRLHEDDVPALAEMREKMLPVHLQAGSLPRMDVLADRGVTYSLLVPIVENEDVTGAIFFNRHRGEMDFMPGQASFARRLAGTLSVSMDTLRLRKVELGMADELRERLRPAKPDFPGLQLGLASQFASRLEQVGGDFVDVFDSAGRFAILMGDVAGKGLGATSVVETIRGAVRALSYTETDPARVLTRVNQMLFEYGREERDMATAFLAFSDPAADALVLAIAGHTSPVFCREECELFEGRHGPPLGAMDDSSYEAQRASFPVGATLVAYTDGVTEARRDQDFFGEERLLDMVRSGRAKEAQKLADDILAQVVEYQDGDPADDAIVLVARRV